MRWSLGRYGGGWWSSSYPRDFNGWLHVGWQQSSQSETLSPAKIGHPMCNMLPERLEYVVLLFAWEQLSRRYYRPSRLRIMGDIGTSVDV